MAKCYAIFFGGVGSMVAQAVVRLCECGYINAEDGIKVLIVDKDEQCGNKTDAVALIGEYNAVSDKFRSPGSDLFKTRLLPVDSNTPRDYFVSPNNDTFFSLEKNIFGEDNRESYDMMKFLYSEDVYKYNFANGFFGNPSAGSLVFLDWLRAGNERLIVKMFQDIKQDCETGDTRVFLVGSLFGGTGAASLPVMAKVIRGLIEGDKQKNLKLGACLLLPYFTYNTDGDEHRIDNGEFDSYTKKVLEFYYDDMKEDVFDKAYLLGEHSAKAVRSEYADAGAKQRNWPSVTELIAASALEEFFSSRVDFMDAQEGGETRRLSTEWLSMGIKGDSIKAITWDDFPNREAFKMRLKSFEVFNYIFSFGAVPLLLKINENPAGGLFSQLDAKDVKAKEYGWIHENFVRGALLMRSHNSWYEGVFSQDDFEMLFRYLGKSADYYYKMICIYNNANFCGDCKNENCAVAESSGIKGCLRSDFLLPNLFDLEPLVIRANILDFLYKKRSHESFQKECDYVLKFLMNDAQVMVNQPIDYCWLLSKMNVEAGGDLSISAHNLFLKLLDALYKTAKDELLRDR